VSLPEPAFELVERNLRALFRHFAAARPAGEVRELPGVSIASSGVAFHMFNAAFLSETVEESPSELEARIAGAAVHFSACGQRWAYWVCQSRLGESLRSKAQAVFHRNGLGLAVEHPGMLADRVLPPARPLPPLEIRAVRSEADRQAFCHVNAVAFGIPFPWCREVYDLEAAWGENFAGYLGCVRGEPVSTAATMMAEGVAGLYCVATLPGQCGKGYAETVVRHALKQARERFGVERTILQACASALPLYRRMGYEVVTRFSVYTT
jgi:ribosomal protein S18 acetylase RimI-like enzyme